MSEPMSAGEIEDVLSSIRRLVSEELRPLARVVRVEPDEKLILTPALRVVSSAGPIVAAPDRKSAVVTLVADALGGSAVFEGETGDPEPQVASAPMAWNVEPDDEDDDQDVRRIDGFVFQSRQNGATQGLSPWPPKGVVADPAEYEGEVLQPTAPPAQDDEGWAQDGPADIEDTGDTNYLDALDSSADADPDWVDLAEAEVIAGLSAQAADLGAETDIDDRAEPSLFAHDVQFDETVLRDLVRDLIRQELQGALGERITRNVRKLVRVEVARALSLHDFE